MNNRVSLRLILIALALLFINSFITAAAIGPLSCEITDSCSYGDILHLYEATDSHAQLTNNTGANYSVCCRDMAGNATMGAACTGIYENQYQNISHLNQVNNSHAELANYSNYEHNSCINTTTGYLFCYYASSCDTYETCLFTLYNYSNSHIGSCSVSGIKVCCNLDECIDDSDCDTDEYCWGGDCYTNETITINNLGQTGFEQTNPEYTSSRAVVLSLTYDKDLIDKCRYSNDNLTWNAWETCQPYKFWYLSGESGLKTVYYNVNRTDGNKSYASDTITYEPEGRYLDVTEPSYPTVIDEGEYTNSDSSLYAYWYGANDPELYFIGKGLEYAYRVHDNTSDSYLNSWSFIGTKTFVNATGLSLTNNHTYTFEIKVNNSANLTNTSISDGILVDLIKPNVSVTCSRAENAWSSNNTIFLNWSATETTIQGYSFVLDLINNTNPDRAIESNNTNYTHYADDGQWYFHIKAKDGAGNWGNTTSYGYIGIDTTPPNIPVVLNPERFASTTDLNFSWTTYDAGSGVINVSLNISEINGSQLFFRWLGNITSWNVSNATINKSYFATVTAKDRVNLTRTSETVLDLNAPEILFSKPNGTIRNDPVIVIITDETAVCQFNSTDFKYTNSTYHETKIENLADGTYQFNILCTDIVGYTAVHNIDFTLNSAQQVSSLSLDSPSDGYVYDEINITVNAGLGEIRKQEFKVYVNNKLIDDFSVFDKGQGNYSLLLKFTNPGSKSINVSVDNQMTSDSITLADLLLSVEYTLPVNPVNKSRLTYHETKYYAVGLASDSSNAFVESDSSKLEIESQFDGNAYIFVTKTGRYLEQNIEHLKRKTFEDTSHAFGYRKDINNRYNIWLLYDGLIVNAFPDLFLGRYKLLLKNSGLNAQNRTVIDVSLKND